MTIGFAGSRCVDERRRRRLAQEAEHETQPERRSAPRTPSAHHSDAAPEPFVPRSPIESLIRPEAWVNVLWCLFAMAVWGGLLALGHRIDRLYPALSAAFGLQEGLLLRAVRAGSLLISAQLSFVVLWHRSRSRKDFGGRYKVWFWVVPACLLFALCAATDAHWHAGRAVQARWPLDVRDMAALVWIIPAAIVLLALTRLLQIEMRGSRISVGCLWLSTFSAAVVAALVLAGHLLSSPESVRLTSAVAVNLWAFALGLSLWHYTRRVLHVSAEAADVRSQAAVSGQVSGVRAALRRWWTARAQARAERRAARAAERAKKEAATCALKSPVEAPSAPARAKPAADVKARPAAEARPSTPVAAPAAAPRQDERRVIPSVNLTPKPAPVAPTKPAATPIAPERPATVTMRIDDARSSDPDGQLDDEDEDQDVGPTSGLSKKERRRLRKLQRQQQRGGEF
jgi:hypothetical protein